MITSMVDEKHSHIIHNKNYAITFEPPHGKTNNLHIRKQAKLISAFVFATRIS